MKVAIYARYSSDNQRDASIADQLRMCRLHAEKQGWHVIEEYTDHAISGASLIRPGIQALMTDAMAGRFDVILSEAMDRLSRDQEDIAGIFKRVSYADVKIFTLSEGEVSHLHVGLKGTMNALFLKDLADKTRRGQLVHTLEILLNEAINTSAAARALFLNRHSLLYRIKLIEDLTGLSLKNPADRFQLEVSVRVHQINEARVGSRLPE